jgi:hypothetical protein
MVHISVFKIICPPSDTSGAYADISILMTKLPVDVFRCVFIMESVDDSHFVAVECGNTGGV